MTQAPCYDVANKKDCPDRQWCKTVGRSNCPKWVEYERIHRAELDEANERKRMDQINIKASRERRDKFLKRYTHGKRRIGSC